MLNKFENVLLILLILVVLVGGAMIIKKGFVIYECQSLGYDGGAYIRFESFCLTETSISLEDAKLIDP